MRKCPSCSSSLHKGASKRGLDGRLWESRPYQSTFRWYRKPTKARRAAVGSPSKAKRPATAVKAKKAVAKKKPIKLTKAKKSTSIYWKGIDKARLGIEDHVYCKQFYTEAADRVNCVNARRARVNKDHFDRDHALCQDSPNRLDCVAERERADCRKDAQTRAKTKCAPYPNLPECKTGNQSRINMMEKLANQCLDCKGRNLEMCEQRKKGAEARQQVRQARKRSDQIGELARKYQR